MTQNCNDREIGDVGDITNDIVSGNLYPVSGGEVRKELDNGTGEA